MEKEKEIIDHKIDFSVIFSVKDANPNGDPHNDNRPRERRDSDGKTHIVIAPVCLKHKIRYRLHSFGETIFILPEDIIGDGQTCLQDRAKALLTAKSLLKGPDAEIRQAVTAEWADIRMFGSVILDKESKAEKKMKNIGISGPITMSDAVSIEPLHYITQHITRCIDGTERAKGKSKGSDTMGSRHLIPFGIFICHGSIDAIQAKNTGLTRKDVDNFIEAMRTMFIGDASAARPAGSMNVMRVIVWEHNGIEGKYSEEDCGGVVDLQESIHITRKEGGKKDSPNGYEVTVDEVPGAPVPVIYKGKN